MCSYISNGNVNCVFTAGYGTATYMSPSTTQVAGKVGLHTNNVKSPASNTHYPQYSNHTMAEAASPRQRNAPQTQMMTGPGLFPSANAQYGLTPQMGGAGSQSAYNSLNSSYPAQYGDESPQPESMSPYYQGGSGDMNLPHQMGHSLGQPYQMLGVQPALMGAAGHQSLGSYHGHHHHHSGAAGRSRSQQDSPMTGVQMQQSPVPS